MNTTRKSAAGSAPPDNLPIYRLLSGADDATFCRRVSDALALGYLLYGSPAATFNGKQVIVAQAVIWPTATGSIATGGGLAVTKPATRRARTGR